MASFFVETPAEFRFDQCLHFLKRSPHELLHYVNGDSVEKFLSVNGRRVIFSIQQSDENKLKVVLLRGQNSLRIHESIRDYINDWFDLKTNLKPFYAMAKKDPLLKSLVKQYFGYRIVGIPDLFEALCWAIIGQQINLSFAYQLKKRFVQEFGETTNFWERVYYFFPEPSRIALLNQSQLLKLQFSRQKADYVIRLARTFSEGSITKEKLSSMSFQDARLSLLTLKGVGNWTAQYALMKTFHDPDAFPLQDAGLHQALKKHWSLEMKPSLSQIESHFKRYDGWKAYATLYLWRSLG